MEKGTPEHKKARTVVVSHASTNGSPTGGSILLTRPPSRMLVF